MSVVTGRTVTVEITDPLGVVTRERLSLRGGGPDLPRIEDSRTDWYEPVPDVRWVGWAIGMAALVWVVAIGFAVSAVIGWLAR